MLAKPRFELFLSKAIVICFFYSGLDVRADEEFTNKNLQISARKNAQRYKVCRTKAAEQLKMSQINRTLFDKLIAQCNDNYPAASLYIACKKNVTKKLAQKKISKNTAAKLSRRCRNILKAAAFDPSDPVPITRIKDRIFFTSIGLNHPIDYRNIEIPNFSCKNLTESIKSPEKAEFFFLSNNLKSFGSLAGMNKASLAKKFAIPNENALKGHYIPDIGLLLNGLGKDSQLFFPLTSCIFEKKLGNMFSGITSYYILSNTRGHMLPYFVRAYYRPDYTNLSTKEIIEEFSRSLNLPGKAKFKATKTNPRTIIIANNEIKATDSKGLPRNICNSPRKHRFLGVIKLRHENLALPQNLTLVNVKNLCIYGDRRVHDKLNSN